MLLTKKTKPKEQEKYNVRIYENNNIIFKYIDVCIEHWENRIYIIKTDNGVLIEKIHLGENMLLSIKPTGDN